MVLVGVMLARLRKNFLVQLPPYLPYVGRCSPRGQNTPQSTILLLKKIKSYPTWLIDGKRYERILTVEVLEKLSRFNPKIPIILKIRGSMSKQPSVKMLTDPGHLVALSPRFWFGPARTRHRWYFSWGFRFYLVSLFSNIYPRIIFFALYSAFLRGDLHLCSNLSVFRCSRS